MTATLAAPTAEPNEAAVAAPHEPPRAMLRAVARGEYVTYLKTMAALLPRERIHVVDSGEFFTEPERVYDGILKFLDLPNIGYPRFERHNARPRATALPVHLRDELAEHFAPYDAALARWLGRTPSWMA